MYSKIWTRTFTAVCSNKIGFSPPRLQASPVLAGRLAEVFRAVAAEIAQGGEVHAVGNLRE